MIDPQLYRPPFTTETDEPTWDDCNPCSFLMLAASWTAGECLYKPTGDRWDLKRLRERLRNYLPADKQRGPLDMADARAYLKAEWPFLDLPMSRSDWPAILTDLRNGHSAVAQGNPSGAPDGSPLRRWTTNDDFGHFIFLDRADSRGIFVMDPLGRGAYDGEWVPPWHVRAYAKDGVVNIITVKRGSETAEARTRRRAATMLASTVSDYTSTITSLNARITDLQAALIPIEDAVAAEHERTITAAVAAVEGLR